MSRRGTGGRDLAARLGFDGFSNFDDPPSALPSAPKNSFRERVRASYNAPQRFLNEQSRLVESRQKTDVFDPFRARTVADSESDFQKRWRKRGLSPPRADPFARKPKHSQRRHRHRQKKQREARPTDSDSGESRPQPQPRSYREMYDDHKLEKKLDELKREAERVSRNRKRSRYLASQKTEDPHQDEDEDEDEGPPKKRRRLTNDNRSSGRTQSSLVQRPELESLGRGDRGRRGRGRGHGRGHGRGRGRGRGRRHYEWGKPGDELLGKEDDSQVIVERPNFKPSGLLGRNASTDERGVVRKWTCPLEAELPTSGWRFYVYEAAGTQDRDPVVLAGKKFFTIGSSPETAEIVVSDPSVEEQHAVVCFRPRRGDGVVVPFLIDLETSSRTLLNRKPIEGARYYEMSGMDEIHFGRASLSFILIDESVLDSVQ